MRRLWIAPAAAVLAALIGNPGARAQVPPGAQPAPRPGETGRAPDSGAITLGDVVIQGRRVNELQQKTPVAVTTVTGDQLRNHTVEQVQSLQYIAPSLEIASDSLGGAADPVFTLRGLSTNILVDPAVVTYFDDVVADSRNLAYALYDLDSVQVLKGPQGTLFGKNSTGGAVLFAPKRPAPAFGGYLDFRYGRFNERDVQGVINLPASAKLWIRAAGDLDRRDGTIHSVTGGPDYNNRNHESARVEALWRPSGDLSNYTDATAYRVRETNSAPILRHLNEDCPNPAPATIFGLIGELSAQPYCAFEPPLTSAFSTPDIAQQFARQQQIGIDRTVENRPLPRDVDYEALTNTTTYKTGPVTLKDIIHTDLARYLIGFDFDGTPAPLLDQTAASRNHLFSNEFQVLGSLFANRLSWIAGGYYSELDLKESDTDHQIDFPLNPNNPLLVVQREPETSYAVFGQVNYDLSDWLKGLSATLGYRYTWDHRSFTQSRMQGSPPACGLGGFPNVDANCVERLSEHFSHENYNLSLNWQMTPDLLAYLATREGYKAGGFNFTASEPEFITYQPETLRDAEAGMKADWRVGPLPLRTNLAVFRANYENIQSEQTRVDPVSGNLEALIVNADPVTGLTNKATLWGGEIELTSKFTHKLQVSAFASYTHTVYDQFRLAGLDVSGEPVDVFPRTFGVTATYTLDTPSELGRPVFTAALYHRAGGTSNKLDETQSPGPFTTLDLRLDWRDLLGKPIDVAVYGTNVTNARYIDLGLDLRGEGVGIASQQFSEPGAYGIELRYHFGAPQ